MMHVRSLLFCFLCIAFASAPAAAVLIGPGDGTGNTSAPADDPGWANVGARSGSTAVYLGNRWVLTVAHVGGGPVTLRGVAYAQAQDPVVRIQTGTSGAADLVLLRLESDPGLPAIPIASATPRVGEPVVMIGNGRDRGAPVSVFGRSGFSWASGRRMRWGTNLVSETGLETAIPADGTVTRSFTTDFSQLGATASEAQAAEGDSGGPVFVRGPDGWVLAGVVFSITPPLFQPPETSLFGNVTYAADLAQYRAQILAVISPPACRDGIDNDGNGLVDFPNDPGCSGADDAVEASGALSISATPTDLGAVPRGSQGRTLVALSNFGTADLVVRAIGLQPKTGTGFGITAAPALPLVLPPVSRAGVAGVAYVEVGFAPSEIGSAAAAVVVASDDPSRPVASVDLSATGSYVEARCFGLDQLRLELHWDKRAQDKLAITGGAIDLAGRGFDPARETVTLLLEGAVVFRSDPRMPPRMNKSRTQLKFAAGEGIAGNVALELDLARGLWNFWLDDAQLGAFGHRTQLQLDLVVGDLEGSLVVPLTLKRNDRTQQVLAFDSRVRPSCPQSR